MTTKSFLVVYNRRTRELDLREYAESESDQARHDRFQRELAERHRPDIEVVLFHTDSLERLKKTHSHYFTGSTRVA